MAGLLDLIITNPLADVAILVSVLAGLSFLLFLRGFLSGLKQLSTIDENAEHLAHYRTRAIHGVALLYVIFGAWETFRVAAAAVQGQPMPSALWIAVFFILACVVIYAKKLLFSSGGGGH